MAKDALGHGSDARGGSAGSDKPGSLKILGVGAHAWGSPEAQNIVAAAHQAGVNDAMTRASNSISPEFAKGELAGAGKSDMNSYTARMVLQATGSKDKDFHTLNSTQADALHDYAKQFGFRKSASSPGSTGRAFHGYLHKQLYK